MSIRVLQLTGTPRKGTGGNIVSFQLAQWLKKRRIKTLQLALIKKGERKTINADIKYLANSSWGLLNPSTILRFIKYLQKNKINTIHSHDFRARFYAILAKLWLKNIKVVIHDHGFYGINSLVFYKFFAPFADRIIAVSRFTKKNILKINNNLEEKIKVVYNGIDVKDFLSKRSKTKNPLSIKKDVYLVLIVARLYKIKGLDYAIRALAKLERKNVVLIIVGFGPDKSRLEKMAQNLGVDKKVKFLGYREDIPYLISQVDLCLNTSLKENCPLSIFEYMTSKKPIIASARGGNLEIIKDKKTGLLTNLNPTEIAKKIEFLMGNPQKANVLAKNAFRAVKKFSLSITCQQIKNIYQELLN